jgi:CubicO group peptidase (beta-lactamase class C family)
LQSERSTRARRALIFLCLGAVVALQGCASGSQPIEQNEAGQTAQFDRLFDDVVARYRLPGLALGIVRDGRVVYQRTTGELIAGSGQRIDGDTLFKIASNSKAMTTGVLARLVDRGKLHWDDPVTQYLPEFKMSDPWVTRELQVRDLLIHNSGLREGAGDLMLWPEPNQFTRADILAAFAHLKPQQSFRSSYAYDNLMYVVAGEVAAAASGVPYETLVARELFEPLGMTRCQAGAFERDRVGNVAQPHRRDGERNLMIRADAELIPVSTSVAAGGIRCSLNDMLKWVTLLLSADMKPSSASLPWLPPARRDELWRPQMPLQVSARQRRWDGSRFSAYGYGWRLSDVHGALRVAHTGTLAGMYSAVTLLPERGDGFVFMINGEGSSARIVLNQTLIETLMGNSKRTVASYADELEADRRAAPSPQNQLQPGMPVEPDGMRELLGVYRDPWFGEVSVCPRDNGVQFVAAKSPRMAGRLIQTADRVLVDWHDESVDVDAWLDFSTDQGTPVMLMTKVDPEADFSFDFEDLRFVRTAACP